MEKRPALSLYWKCQIIGWSVASLYWGLIGFIGGHFNFYLGLLQFVSDVLVYIALTHLYRNFALSHHWQDLGFNDLLKRIIPAVVVMGLAYTLVTSAKIMLFRFWFVPYSSQSLLQFLQANGLTIFVAGIRLMSIWLLAYHLYHYAQREINASKENARLAIITRDAQLSNLSAQLNPHFLFNSLNTIKALIIENPTSARRGIDLLSELLRTSIYHREIMTTTINDEINLAKDQLELEKLRMEERLKYTIQMDEGLAQTPILRWSIQTLVENAIKHGINQHKEGGLILINVQQHNRFIKIDVENPGQLSTSNPGTGLGLKNLEERLEIQYKGKASFNIMNLPQGKILATILIPST